MRPPPALTPKELSDPIAEFSTRSDFSWISGHTTKSQRNSAREIRFVSEPVNNVALPACGVSKQGRASFDLEVVLALFSSKGTGDAAAS